MWPLFAKRVRPTITPRASSRQYGAKSPENAGTKTTPPESSTDRASCSTSGASSMRPRLSRSHWTSAPAHGDRALQRVHRVGIAELPRDGGDQTMLGDHRLRPQREQQEGSGAVRVLDVAVIKARVTDSRRRLVPQDPGHRHAGQLPGGQTVHLAGRAD